MAVPPVLLPLMTPCRLVPGTVDAQCPRTSVDTATVSATIVAVLSAELPPHRCGWVGADDHQRSRAARGALRLPAVRRTMAAGPAKCGRAPIRGKERDPETTFNYFGVRYYASGTGRLTTVDPVLDTQNATVDPRLWNRYAYSRNNPLGYIDPDGRYVADGAKDDAPRQERAAEFEVARQQNLRSADRSVRNAAAAYGQPEKRNGINVFLNANMMATSVTLRAIGPT